MDIISKFFQELTEIKKSIEILIWGVTLLTKIYKFVFRFIVKKLKRKKSMKKKYNQEERKYSHKKEKTIRRKENTVIKKKRHSGEK